MKQIRRMDSISIGKVETLFSSRSTPIMPLTGWHPIESPETRRLYKRARGLLRQVKKNGPDHPALLTLINAIRGELNKSPEPAPRLLSLHGELLHRAGDPDDSLRSHERAVRLRPEAWIYRYRYAEALYATRHYEKCIQQCEAIPSTLNDTALLKRVKTLLERAQPEISTVTACEEEQKCNAPEETDYCIVEPECSSDATVPSPLRHSPGFFARALEIIGFRQNPESVAENTAPPSGRGVSRRGG